MKLLPTFLQPFFLIIVLGDLSEARAATYGFVAERPQQIEGDRPESKRTPFCVRLLSPDLLASDEAEAKNWEVEYHVQEVQTSTIMQAITVLSATPVKLIIDTDIGGGGCEDVDDVAAVCIAHALADNGEAELLAMVQNSAPPPCAGVLSVLSEWYGHGNLALGAYKGNGLTTHGNPPLSYVTDLATNFPSTIHNSSQVPDAVAVYRRALASAPARSVAISSIGLMTNLEQLLRSGPDEFSELSGADLVAQKVLLLAAMAGAYPNSGSGDLSRGLGSGTKNLGPNGAECNMCGCYNGVDETSKQTAASASAYVYSHMPPSVKIIFSGLEVGIKVRTGAVLENCAPVASPCRRAFMDYKRDNAAGWAAGGRCSWDPLTMLVAVRGASAAREGVTECTGCDGVNHVTNTGSNYWVPGPKSNQSYLILEDPSVAANAIDKLLCQPAARRAAAYVRSLTH